jgi:hypothetical protein
LWRRAVQKPLSILIALTSARDSLPIAVVLDGDDARALLTAAPACRAVLALTPAARAELTGTEVPVFSSRDFYSSIGHRRTLLHQRRAIAESTTALEQESKLNPAAQEALIIIMFYLTSASARLATTLRQAGPWLVRDAGNWRHCDERAQVHALLLRRIVDARFDVTLREKFGLPPLPGLARWLTRLAARAYRGKGAVLLGYGRRQLNRLGDEIVAVNPTRPVLALRATQGGWRDQARIVRGLWQALRGRPRSTLHALPLASTETAQSAQRVLASLREPAARAAIAAASAVPQQAAALTAGLARHTSELFAAARPAVLVTDSLGWGPGGAAGEAARTNGVPVLFLSHSSHAAQTTPAARAAVDLWIRYGRVLSRFATTLLPKTPHAARAAESARSEGRPAARVPYVWLSRDGPVPRRQDDVFRVLHACNFAPWSEHVPWAMQTSDEFCHGIAVLAEVAGDLDWLHLVVRPKAKAECNAGILQRLLPARPNVEFRHGGSFAQDLADADLVVSYSSSTIEEALHLRTPVLLWGGGVDYRHLPAREAPPQPEDRTAVYVAASKAGLARMLPAIAAAHRGRPLRDEELRDHLWPDGTPDWSELARRLAKGEAPEKADQEQTASKPA